MKLFGSLSEIVSLIFRKNSQAVTLRPNQSTTYTASRDIQLPPGDTAHVLASASSTQTLTNKTIDGDDNTVQDLPVTAIKTVLGDADKVLRRDASGVPQSGNSIPNTSALVTIDASQTLTNKTISGGDITPLTLTVNDDALTIRDQADNTKQAQFQASSISTGTTRTYTLPDVSTTIAGTDASQILSNKALDNTNSLTIKDNVLTIQDDGDATKQARFQASGITAGQVRTLTIPDASTTIVGHDATQVLTNKDIDGATASNTSRITLPKASTATISGLTRKEATLAYDTDLDVPVYDNGVSVIALATAASSLDSPSDAKNYTISASVAANALTVALKTKAGTDPTSGDPVAVSFRNATAATGTYSVVQTTSAISLTVPSGATLGHSSGVVYSYYVYQLNNAGTPELAISTKLFDTQSVVSTTALSAGSDSADVMYSTSSRSGVAVRLLGRLTGSQTTAGTWAAVPTEISLGSPVVIPPVISAWTSYTPTYQGMGTVTTNTMQWRRVGQSMEIRGKFTMGTTTGVTALIGLPTGYSAVNLGHNVMTGTLVTDTAANNSPYTTFAGDTGFITSMGIGRLQACLTALSGGSFVSSSVMSINASIPIVEFS